MARGHEAAAKEAAPKTKKTKKRKRLLLEANAEQSANEGDNNLVKALGSPDYQTRDKALDVLTLWLTKRPSITDKDLMKIWKGLFYTFWHSDKQPVQEALAERLALILPQLQPQVAFAYWAAFMETLRREWFGIDRLRLDKFMNLARQFVRQTFEHLRLLDWAADEVDRFSSQLAEAVLLNRDASPDLGFVFHLSDCWVPELLGAHQSQKIPALALEGLMTPFIQLLSECDTTAGMIRITRGAFEPLLDAYEAEATESPPTEPTFLHDMADALFAAGASESCRVKNRDTLYTLSRRMHKAADQTPAVLPHQESQQQQQQQQQRPPSSSGAALSQTSASQPLAKIRVGLAKHGKLSRSQDSHRQPGSSVKAPNPSAVPAGGINSTVSCANGISESIAVHEDGSLNSKASRRKSRKSGSRLSEEAPSGEAAATAGSTPHHPKKHSEKQPEGQSKNQSKNQSKKQSKHSEPVIPDSPGVLKEPPPSNRKQKQQKRQHTGATPPLAAASVAAAHDAALNTPTPHGVGVSAASSSTIPGSHRVPAEAATASAQLPSTTGPTAFKRTPAARGRQQSAARSVATTLAIAGSIQSAEADSSPATPLAAFASSEATLESSKRKSVQFLMKKNLYFSCGGPLLPPEVRTPPGISRFPGSALRAAAPDTEPVRRRLHVSSISDTPGKGLKGKGKVKSPKSAPRARAAAFF